MRATRGLVGDLSSALFAGNDGHGTVSVDPSKAKPQRDRHELCLILVGQNSQIARFHEERRSIGDRDFHTNSGVPRIVPIAGRPPLGRYGGGTAPAPPRRTPTRPPAPTTRPPPPSPPPSAPPPPPPHPRPPPPTHP